MKPEYVLPEIGKEAFNCPNCHVYCKQNWYYLRGSSKADGLGKQHEDKRFRMSHCQHCDFPTIWFHDKMLYPVTGGAEPPNPDLPNDIKTDYEEARAILPQSPRGSAALLRLAIQKLCKHLGQSGKNINNDIKELVEQGLPPRVQKALDSVRVIGNESVHPGTIDLNDDRDTANMLFKLVNFIAEKMITDPKQIEEIYASLPENKRKGIEQRDSQ